MVSIIIINYNDKKRIRRAIDSAVNQSYGDVEVIVVDDGSDEETRKLYEGIKEIKLIQLERKDKQERNPSRPRNTGIKEAKGDYICFLDSDNYYHPDFVKNLIALNADIAFCNWRIEGLENYEAIIQHHWKNNKSLLENYLLYTHLDHQCLLIKKSILDKVGIYDERFPRSQDCEMIVKLMINTNNWKHCRDILFVFNKHEKDQMKTIASYYYKTLWCLKYELSFEWMLNKIKRSPHLVLVFVEAINYFMNSKEFLDDRQKNKYIKIRNQAMEILKKEVSE